MNAPLRLYAADRSALAGPSEGPIDSWLTRLVKLVPAEIVAVYLAGRPLAAARFEHTWPVACLILTIIVRAFGTNDGRGPQWLSIAISAVSFVIWVYATGGQFLTIQVDTNVAALAVLVWTTLVPAIWRGDPARRPRIAAAA
jgi:hypothetical protein